MRTPRLLALCCLSALTLPALAAPQDDVTIVKHCGLPLSDQRAISQVTNEYQRNLTYPDDVVYHLQPVEGGWRLSGAWVKHLPESRESVASRIPCVGAALAESARTTVNTPIDPTIAAQSTPEREGGTFGIPGLWWIALLAGAVILVVILPNARRRRKPEQLPEPRVIQRKPDYERASSAAIRRYEE